MKRVCVFFADGFEEVEALTAVDLLRRAEVYVTMVSISDSLHVRGRSNIEVIADELWENAKPEKSDMLVLPRKTRYCKRKEGDRLSGNGRVP